MQGIDEGLVFEDKLAVSIKTIPSIPGANQLSFSNSSNENILKASLLPQEQLEVDDHDDIRVELRRQDIKINLLLDMISELLTQKISFPTEIDIKLTASKLECGFTSDFYSMKIGEFVEVSLFISPSTPKALTFYGEVTGTDNQSSSIIRFIGMNQSVQDWLEKIIFRHHRRSIAQNAKVFNFDNSDN